MSSLPRLDAQAVRGLVSEENSSQYVIDAHNRQIECIVDMSEVPELKSLDVSFNKLKTLENIDSLTGLKEIKAYNNQLTKITGLERNTKLERLYLSHNSIQKISNLAPLRQLQQLRLDGNRISTVENFTSLKSLLHLDLSLNRLQGVCSTGLEALVSLETLNLSDNNLTSFGNLKHMHRMEEINVSGNNFTSLDGLHGLHSIVVIRASRNKIQSLKSLPAIKSLAEIYIDNNPISSLKELVKKTPNLEILDAHNCRVRGIKDIAPLNVMEKLEDIWLSGNPCALSEEYHRTVCNTLEHLQTLDEYTRMQILEHPEILQHRPSSARPDTAGRARTPLLRPMTPGAAAKEGRPLVYQPSARAGNQVKMLTSTEIIDGFEKMRSRIKSVRERIDGLGKTQDNNQQLHIHEDIVQEKRSVGTDPLISIPMLNTPFTNNSMFSFVDFEQMPQQTPVHEMRKRERSTPEQDIDAQMKLELQQNLAEADKMVIESPRVERTNRSYSGKRPNRTQGFRKFHIPTMLKNQNS